MSEEDEIPFMPVKGKPAYHLREATLEELEQHRRMIAEAERLRRIFTGEEVPDGKDTE